jgi:general stress protein 26
MEVDMTETDIDRVWKLMQSIRYCMFSNWNGTRLHSRPMGAFVRPDEGAVYFFTDERAHKDEEIRRYPQVNLAFADTHGQKYLSVSGNAEILTDREKIKELWAVPAKVWWKTPDNPNLRLIKITPVDAEYWDAPGNVISSFNVAFALVTGGYPTVGKHKKVPL